MYVCMHLAWKQIVKGSHSRHFVILPVTFKTAWDVMRWDEMG